MTHRTMTTGLLALALVAAPAAAAPRAENPIREQKLPNGLTLILAPDAHAGGVDVTVWYRAGTRWERAGHTGLTHVVEQLMFRSTPAAGQEDYITRVRRAGGSVGAESTPDYSSFFQTVPPEVLDDVFAMEADRMTALRITPEAFAEVKRLVRQNRERAGHTPIVLGMQQLYGDVFEGHPYACPAIGREEDLDALTLDDCLAWHRARYGPGNAIVTVAGRFRPEDVIASAKRTLGRVPRREVPRDAQAPLPAGDAVRRTVGSYAFPGPSVLLGWRVPGGADADAPALELLARCLSGDPTAPLERALTGQGRPTAYTSAGVELRREAGLFFVLAALQPGADSAAVAAVEQTMLDEIARAGREGVAGERLVRAQKAQRVDRLFSLQRPRDRAAALGRGALVIGRTADALAVDAPGGTVAAATVRDVAARLLASRPPVTVWMLPAGPAGGGR